jgi:hypothetical protein
MRKRDRQPILPASLIQESDGNSKARKPIMSKVSHDKETRGLLSQKFLSSFQYGIAGA